MAMEPGEQLPQRFTYPFRYVPHPLCVRAARCVQQQLVGMGIAEGKMYGVMIVRNATNLAFLAAYSGQLQGSYAHPWFVPPVVDYLDPQSHFQREQQEIVDLGHRLDDMRESTDIADARTELARLLRERADAVAAAKSLYDAARQDDDAKRDAAYIRLRQHQKADIQRAKHLHATAIADIQARLANHNAAMRDLHEQRRRRSEELQQWLFRQFDMLNARGQRRNIIDIFADHGKEYRAIPAGAGECCAPKLLQTAYAMGLQPIAMAEFWWGPSSLTHYREPGAFFPACRSKCLPILTFMLQGLDVEPDPANHYDSRELEEVRVVWEDDDVAVIAKPGGWCSIPGRSDQPNLLDEAHRLWPDITGSVIVHRLDQDTSGLMVLAKNPKAHCRLGQQFERREVDKHYVALLDGRVDGEGVITLPICPDPENMPHQHVDRLNGKEAVTEYRVLGVEAFGNDGKVVTRILFHPVTGRTHQLRLHSAAAEGLATPILGDRLYGRVDRRLYLHASTLDFNHPVTHQRLHFELPAPF